MQIEELALLFLSLAFSHLHLELQERVADGQLYRQAGDRKTGAKPVDYVPKVTSFYARLQFPQQPGGRSYIV